MKCFTAGIPPSWLYAPMMKHTLNAKVLGLSIANLLSLAALLGALVGATSAGSKGPHRAT